MDKSNIPQTQKDLDTVKGLFQKLLDNLPILTIGDEDSLPFGLKPHTRSISWISEQVIVQQLKSLESKLNIDEVEYELPDTSLHDVQFQYEGQTFYVNIKTHQSGNRSRNDIAAVEKLYNEYLDNPSYSVIYACFEIGFEKRSIIFKRQDLIIFSPQFIRDLYVNPNNNKIQATYQHEVVARGRDEFLVLLKPAVNRIARNR
jgi:hypothetical protein